MPRPLLYSFKQIWIRSFKWGTLHSCRSSGMGAASAQISSTLTFLILSCLCYSKYSPVHSLYKMQPRIQNVSTFLTVNFKVSQFWNPLTKNKCLVPHLKDLIHICLEPEAHRRGRTLRGIFRQLKYLEITTQNGNRLGKNDLEKLIPALPLYRIGPFHIGTFY